MLKTLASLLVGAILLGACGGGGTGAPKQYPGKTADPGASPDYYGY